MTEEADVLARLRVPRFPRAAAYDPQWIVDNEMGPNPLWLPSGCGRRWTCHRGRGCWTSAAAGR